MNDVKSIGKKSLKDLTMKEQNQSSFIPQLIFVGMMFFFIGFALGINSFLIPVLNGTLGVSSTKAYLVLAAIFSTFILFSYPATITIKKIGYKYTMALSFLLFAVGFLLCIFSANYKSFVLFLIASFISGIGNTFLQASVNPYITILGPIESAAKRMSIMGICNKLAWPVAPVFLAWVIGKNISEISSIDDLILPFWIIIVVFIAIGIISLFAPLPNIKAIGEDESGGSVDYTFVTGKTSVWQFPHLIWGAVTLFLYVGVEVVALSTLVDYASTLQLPNPSNYAWISSIGMVTGYICGIAFIPKYISQAKALIICASVAIIGSVGVVLTPGILSIWFISLIAFGCSLIWPAIWPLAIADLGRFTKTGSSILVMAIAGGAVIPTIFGFIKDKLDPQNAYWVCLPCFLFILYYGIEGHKKRTI